MTRHRPAHISDDEVVNLARRYRRESIAALVTVLRDEHAPASARAAASAKLLEYSDGKPSQARQITVADLATMPDSLREELFHALLNHYMPNGHQQLLKQAVDDALAQAGLTLPAPNRFKRGPLAGKGPEVPRWPPAPVPAPPLAPPADPIRRDSSGYLEPAAYAGPESLPAAASPVFRRSGEHAEDPPALRKADDDPPAMRLAGERPDNVRQLPGTRREPALAPTLSHEVERPPAFGIIYGTAETLEHSQASAPNPHGGIHPSVVERSALEDPLGPFDPWRRS